jgi:tetratricopeptide (TPR) repeat protein
MKELERNSLISRISPTKGLTDALGKLYPLTGIEITGLDDELEDSSKLLDAHSSQKEIEFAMLQLREMQNTASEQKAKVFNNLGCAYARLNRYREAERVLQKAIESSTTNDEVKKAAKYNLAVVRGISE